MSAKQNQVGQVKSRIPSRGVKPDFPATDFEIRQASWLAEIDRINQALRIALNQEFTKTKLLQSGTEPVGSSSEELGLVLKNDLAKWTKLIKEKNITAE